ncbi:pumilio homolog 12 isoform X1 [Rhodamnia argentea]|uniref:Pumilio homolog 12 isoform X1 n=2 Tax=Rhodamnia argentea TaxID=178133 RepID=A0ABM3HKH8_9MYRT|nr:pumilio homolog 12 isoform X1 [Rhodamnia argentea]XP_048137109.1 pumilio homolog 12 isoform X1 [Rhodamnia argentea]XP_048137110.1 pumilio homolog 12 isoform X1 [Rhodamnia argentea]
MEEGKNEIEFDEFEKLLGEIPNATSGDSHAGECRLKRACLDDSSLPILVNSCRGPSSEKYSTNGGLHVSMNEVQRPLVKTAQMEGRKLPDDQSFISAFADLSFSNGLTSEAVNHPLTNCLSLPNDAICSGSQYPINLRFHDLAGESLCNNVWQSEDGGFYGSNKYRSTEFGKQNANLVEVNGEVHSGRQFGTYQPIENYAAAVPISGGVSFIPNVPIQTQEFPMIPNKPHYFTNQQSQFSSFYSPRQIQESQFPCRNVEEEHFHSMHQQHLYLQHLYSHQFDSQHAVQDNAYFTTRVVNQNASQSHYEMPVAHLLEQSKQGPFLRSCGNSQCKQPRVEFSSGDVHTVQNFGRISQQVVPEKILTRSCGLNALRALKFGSVRGNELLSHISRSGRVNLNGQHLHNLCNPSTGCLRSESLNQWGSFPDTASLRSADLRLQRCNSLDEVSGRIYLMAKDQNGCRFLQKKFSEGTRKDVEQIFSEVIDHIVELMTDPFGNYLVQKLLEVCDEDQRMRILHVITRRPGDLIHISCDMHGTRVVQKVLETLKTAEEFSVVVSALKPGIVTLMKNTNGNHVAQHCLRYLPLEYKEFLFQAAAANCLELATDRHGCCVLQKCLGHSGGEQKCHLICGITSNALILSQDQFGNYVVQFVFELHVPHATRDILDQLDGNYGDLSMQKYSSNVVEKCLKFAGEEHRTRIIEELMDDPRLAQIMQDPFGNFVIQAALEKSKGALKAAFVDAVRPHVPVLRTNPYGKKVLSCPSLKNYRWYD